MGVTIELDRTAANLAKLVNVPAIETRQRELRLRRARDQAGARKS